MGRRNCSRVGAGKRLALQAGGDKTARSRARTRSLSFRKGAIKPLSPAPPFDEQVIRRAQRFVAMMGIEPLQAALAAGAQVVIAGRCSDVAIYAALPVMRGIPKHVAFHAGKILERGGASAAKRLYPDCMAAELDAEGFTVETLPTPNWDVRPKASAAHTLYENADPYTLVEAGGSLDTTGARYHAVTDRAVRVEGGRFLPAEKYTVRIEGASLAGYRSIVIAGIRHLWPGYSWTVSWRA